MCEEIVTRTLPDVHDIACQRQTLGYVIDKRDPVRDEIDDGLATKAISLPSEG